MVVEAESAKVGECRLPPKLWRAMVAAPRVAIEAPRRARAEYLVRAYADLVADPARLDGIVASLRPLHAAEVIAGWRSLVAEGRFADLAESLMERHYDPRYGKHRARMEVPFVEVAAEGLGAADLPALADRIAAEVARL